MGCMFEHAMHIPSPRVARWMHACIHAWAACSSMPCTYHLRASLGGCTRVYMHGLHVRACHAHTISARRSVDARVYTCMGCMFEHAMHIPSPRVARWMHACIHAWAACSSMPCTCHLRAPLGGCTRVYMHGLH